jgi:hypothetical protein
MIDHGPLFGMALALMSSMAVAEEVADLPAAQCAAFWYGRDDFAQVSAYLDRNDGDAVLAARFRDAAVAETGDAAPVDAFIADERGAMAWLVEAAILGDPQSRALHDRLVERCLGDDLPAKGALGRMGKLPILQQAGA